MNANKKIILIILFIALLFGFSSGVNAKTTVTSFEIYDMDNGGIDTPNEATVDPYYHGQSIKFDAKGNVYYCTQPDLKWPTKCNSYDTFNANFSAALTYLINRYTNNQMSYSAVQRTSSKLLYNNGKTSNRADYNLATYLTQSIDKNASTYYERANLLYANNTKVKYYKNGTTEEITNLDFSAGNVLTISYALDNPFGLECTVDNGGTVTVDTKNKKITIDSKGNHLKAITTLKCRTYYNYKKINLYYCTNQDIMRPNGEKSTLYGSYKSIKSLPYYNVQYHCNGGIGTNGKEIVPAGTYVKGTKITLGKVCNRPNYNFNNYTGYRSDGYWYVGSYGWYTDTQIKNNNYSKKLYTPGGQHELKGAWIKTPPKGDGTNDFYTFTFYAQWTLQSKTLTINKIYKKADGTTGKVISPATFNVYKSNNCTGTPVATLVTSNGSDSVTLDPAIYSVKETVAPKGYVVSNECKVVDLNSSNQTIDILNVGECSTKIEDIKATYTKNSLEYKKALINLYNQEKAAGRDFRKLLNFNNPVCEVKTDCYSKNNNSCLNINYVGDNSFSENDWSCYNDTIKDNNQNIYGYCSTTFNITRNITPQNGYYSVINAGQLLMANKNPITKAKVSSTCYSLGGNISNKTINIPSLSLSNTNLSTNNTNNIITYTKNGNAFVGELNYNYNLPNVYAKKISGKLQDNRGNLYTSSCSDCTYLGTGIPSRFNEGTGSVTFKYSWQLNYDTISGSSSCSYKINPEIIKYNKEPKGELQIEFRTVDPNNPFDRNANSNWCNKGDCNENNKTITDTIVNSTNSYGMNNGVKQTPKYTITLSSSDINKIKTYNKNKTYDDYLFKCEDGTCKSNFLTSLKDGSLLGNNNKLVVN